MNIQLKYMTLKMAKRYFADFENDPAVYQDPNDYRQYVYDENAVEAYWNRQKKHGRIHLAVTLEDRVIGEILFKNIDMKKHCCTLSIHLQNDKVKNRGIGTIAETEALKFAFHRLQMKTVYADALISNTRSCRVLEKAGFSKTGSDKVFNYYKCEKASWQPSTL